MSESCSLADIILRGTACAVAVALVLSPSTSRAQTSDGVSVNLGVLDDIDPMVTVPRLLMPSTRSTGGRIILTPPAGVDPITPQRSRIVLRPPPGAPARVTSAPTIAVPPPAAAAAAPPTSVTSAPPPPPRPEPEPPAPAPAPVAAVTAAPVEDPAPAPNVTADPMPMPAPAAEPETASEPDTPASLPEQTASLPPADEGVQPDGPVSITFGIDETDLPASSTTPLTDLASMLKADESLRVQLMAYASSADGSPSSVRRKSLSRALSVREFLMDQGVQSTRIEVRALGDKNEGGEPNRVDAIVETR